MSPTHGRIISKGNHNKNQGKPENVEVRRVIGHIRVLPLLILLQELSRTPPADYMNDSILLTEIEEKII